MVKKREISYNTIKLLNNEHIAGETIQELSKKINVSETWLSRSFKKNNLPIIHYRIKIPTNVIELILKLYNENKSINEISNITNVCASQVWRVLIKHNICTKKTNFNYREKLRKYHINENYFNKIDTQEKAYILGLLYADGNTNKKISQVTLKLQECDKDILKKISELLETNKPLHFCKKTKETHQNQYVLKITNKVIYTDLIRFGLVPKKTFIITFPDIENNLIPHFLRGYFDGDGCLYIDKKRKVGSWSIIGSTKFVIYIKDMLFSKLNINSFLQHDNRAAQGVDILRIRKYSDVKKICEWIYNGSVIHLHRKYDKFVELKRIKNDYI